MKKIEFTISESIEMFDMIRDCVERGMVENSEEGKKIEKIVNNISDNGRIEILDD